MSGLFQAAYVLALALWVPLAAIAVFQPSVRRRVMVPLAASAIATAYEAYMSLVWSHTVINPIRVDILLVMLALAFIDAVVGYGLLLGTRGRRDRGPLLVSGMLCLGVPALAIVGFAGMRLELSRLDRNFDLSRRFRFEAYFRDDQTELRAFGNLQPLENKWAGYYLSTGDDDRFRHLVINDEGKFWLYTSSFIERTGAGRPVPSGEFEGTGDAPMDARMHMAMRGQDGGPLTLEVRGGLIPDVTVAVPIRKAERPRFPLPSQTAAEVRFVGVFSATYGETSNEFWLTQVWLWESDGEWWGRYLRDPFVRGSTREFIATEPIDPRCSEQCKVLSFQTSRGPVVLTRVSDDEFSVAMRGEYKNLTLKRGETLPGFFLDLAPVATKREHRQWLEALTTAGMISWKVPDKS